MKPKRNEPPPRSLADQAYDGIYRKIMTLEVAPGQRLEDKQLMEALGIGRTPIREALLRLSADFMVESPAGRGFVVRPITLQNTRAAFAALKIMEVGVGGLAVRQDTCECRQEMERANEEVAAAIREGDVVALVEANGRFHQALAESSHNDYLIHGLHKVRCEINRLAYLSFANEIDPLRSLADHYRSVVDQHRAIIRYMAERDEAQLLHYLAEHVEAFQRRILLYMAS
jgi:DNA-binding GntR family transcriptional regulator